MPNRYGFPGRRPACHAAAPKLSSAAEDGSLDSPIANLMHRIAFIGGSLLCLIGATACTALDVAIPAPPPKIIRRLPPVESTHPAIFSIEEIAAANQQQFKFEESFGRVLEITKGIPDSPTFGGWIDVGYNSGSTGWSMDY